jgi:peptidylprolyl isomerase
VRRRLITLTVVSVMLFGAAACGNDSSKSGGSKTATDTGQVAGVTVTGKVGTVPTVKVDSSLKATKTTTKVVTTGDGNPVVEGQQAVLHLDLVNGSTGKKIISTYDQGTPVAYTMSADQFLFPSMLSAIVGQPSGSRVVAAGSVSDLAGKLGTQLKLKPTDSLVVVADVMSVQPKDVVKSPEGTKKSLPSGLPTVVEQGDKVTNLDFSKAPKKPSGKLQVIPLVDGTGPVARDDSLVTVNYFGEQYGAKKPFDESFSKEPVTFPLGVGGLIKGWDEGLVGLKRGSRVMIVAPPNYAYGAAGTPSGDLKNATLVFIVDILGVDN